MTSSIGPYFISMDMLLLAFIIMSFRVAAMRQVAVTETA